MRVKPELESEWGQIVLNSKDNEEIYVGLANSVADFFDQELAKSEDDNLFPSLLDISMAVCQQTVEGLTLLDYGQILTLLVSYWQGADEGKLRFSFLEAQLVGLSFEIREKRLSEQASEESSSNGL